MNSPHGTLPDSRQHEYSAAIEAGDNARWVLGDMLVEDSQYYESDADLFREVSKLGEAISTLRGCKRLSYHVPLVLRERYPLTRSQWRSCLSWGVLAADYEERLERTVEMAEWCIDNNMATVQAIEREVARRKGVDLEARAKRQVLRTAARVLLSLNGDTPPGLVALARVISRW